MKKKRDWKKELEHLNIPYEVVDGKIYLWPEYSKNECVWHWRDRSYSMKEIYHILKKNKGRRYSKVLKEEQHKVERAKTRQMLHHEKEFPSGPVHYEDPWNWD